MGELIRVFPEEEPADRLRWLTKKLHTPSAKGEFLAFPFLGIELSEGKLLPPKVGPGLIWIEEATRKEEFVGYNVDVNRHPPEFSIDHLLRIYRALCHIESIDLFHRYANTLGFCWGIARREVILKSGEKSYEQAIRDEWIGKDVFDELQLEVFFRYKPSESERIILREALSKYGIPFVS